MAKPRRTNSRLSQTAEIAGRSLGRAARALDSLRARHPHPVADAGDAFRAQGKRVARLAAQVKKQSNAAIKKTKASIKSARASATRTRRKTAKKISKAARSTNTRVARGTAGVRRVRKKGSRRLKR